MNIRSATPEDRPAIIELLKKSLGESTIPKSEGLWIWKHEQNPFGPSYILLAEEDNTLIGLRAFMQWKWQWKNQEYKAIRAVDTATHPEHQGKGIFKKLTLQQLSLCKDQGIHFVFNTPNDQSRPGYLKMGWVQQGKMPLKLKVRQPLTLLYSKFFNKKLSDSSADPTPPQDWNSDLYSWVKPMQNSDKLTSVLSPEYIDWRYANNPLFRYNYFTDNESFLMITRVKKYSFAKELRIVDFILLRNDAKPNSINSFLKKAVAEYCKTHDIQLISISGQQFENHQQYFKWMGILPIRQLGPIVTLRDLNMNENFAGLMDQNNWGYSLGDMELF